LETDAALALVVVRIGYMVSMPRSPGRWRRDHYGSWNPRHSGILDTRCRM